MRTINMIHHHKVIFLITHSSFIECELTSLVGSFFCRAILLSYYFIKACIISSQCFSCLSCYSMLSWIFLSVSYYFYFSFRLVFSRIIFCINFNYNCVTIISSMSHEKKDAKSYGLAQVRIPIPQYIPQYGEVMLASDQSKGGLVTIPQSKGKRIISISGGNKKLFIFQVQNQTQRIVTSLHPQNEDYLEYKGEETLPINDIVLALQGSIINEIKSGKEHNIILTEQGQLYSFGKGNFGSLGLGGTVFSPGPQLITKLRTKKIVSIACGMFHSLALSDIGDVYSWGRGFQGQLGLLQTIESTSSPQYVTHFFKYDDSKDVRMLRKTPIISISCGSYHSIAIDNQNQIYCWGQARFGQTGNGKKSKEQTPKLVNIQLNGQKKRIVKADGGFGHTLCLTSQGQIFAWGLNIKGQIGLNDLPQNIKSTQGHLNYVKAAYTPMLIKQSRDKSPLPKFKEIACGFTSSFALDEQGNAWAWGGGNIGFKDKFLQRGPVMITSTTENKKFTKVFANQNSMILFCPLSPLYFKPALVPSSGKTELTFFGNGFINTGFQTVRFTVQEDKIQTELSYDQKTNTFYCKTPVFEKVNKKYSYPLLCKVQVSLDKKQYYSYQKPLLIYSSKLQIQSIQPNCGSVLGGSLARLYMPIPQLVLQYIDSITVGFKNTKASSLNKQQKQAKSQSNQDWICTEGVYQNETISCKIPNIPHFNHQNPFYMIDISLNGQDFTQFPHTFRYYFITQTKIEPNQSEDDAQPECRIKGNGLFDTPNKQLHISLVFTYKQTKINCERKVELKWNKAEKHFQFKMPKLSWIIGDHELKPDLLEQARKQPCILSLILGQNQVVEVGKYIFKLPPPPPQPEEDKKDAKKDNKKGAKK